MEIPRAIDAERPARDVDTHTYARRIQEDVCSGMASGVNVKEKAMLYFNGQLLSGGYDEAAPHAALARPAADGSQAS